MVFHYNSSMDNRYLSLGIQYFILARIGGSLIFNPVSGTLFHLSFETFMKAYLRMKYSDEELKKKFGHNLPKLWKELKTQTGNEPLSNFDYIIDELHIWEKMRYLGFDENKTIRGIEIVPGHSNKQVFKQKRKSKSVYTIYLEDMDELFRAIVFATCKDPKQLRSEPSFQMGMEVYEKDNKYNIFSE